MLSYAAPTIQHFGISSPANSPFADPPSRPPSAAAPPQPTISTAPSRASFTSTSFTQPANQSQPGQRQGSFSGSSFSGLSFGTETAASLAALPALSALASLAANAPAASTTEGGGSTRSSTPNSGINMNQQPQYAPAATAGGQAGSGQQSGPPVCQNCTTSTTPLWRRDESGSVLCNACGLFLKLHGRPRPISLKTDVIKSRNRVKTSSAKKRGDSGDLLPQQQHGGAANGGGGGGGGLAAVHPDVAHIGGGGGGLHPHGHANSHLPVVADGLPGRVPSPASLSRSHTPNHTAHSNNPNIAPQHLFDTVTLPPDTFASPNLPAFNLRQPSPSLSALNGNSGAGTASQHNPDGSAGLSYDALAAQHSALRTRVSELEVINDLFRGRVGELEGSERDARRAERSLEEDNRRLKADVEMASRRVAELEAERDGSGDGEGPARKKRRLSAGGEGGEGGEGEGGGDDGVKHGNSTVGEEAAPGSASNLMIP